jgi:hypothetical protein
VRAADLLLTLEKELDIQRQRALLLEEGLSNLEDDEHRALVIADTPATDHVPVDGELERRGPPLGEVTGRLHVVVSVDQDRRRSGGLQPVGPDHGMTGRRHDSAGGERQLR